MNENSVGFNNVKGILIERGKLSDDEKLDDYEDEIDDEVNKDDWNSTDDEKEDKKYQIVKDLDKADLLIEVHSSIINGKCHTIEHSHFYCNEKPKNLILLKLENKKDIPRLKLLLNAIS